MSTNSPSIDLVTRLRFLLIFCFIYCSLRSSSLKSCVALKVFERVFCGSNFFFTPTSTCAAFKVRAGCKIYRVFVGRVVDWRAGVNERVPYCSPNWVAILDFWQSAYHDYVFFLITRLIASLSMFLSDYNFIIVLSWVISFNSDAATVVPMGSTSLIVKWGKFLLFRSGLEADFQDLLFLCYLIR